MSTKPTPTAPPPDTTGYGTDQPTKKATKCEHGVKLDEECQECRELHGGA